MSNHIFVIIVIQYLLLVCLFLMYMIDNQNLHHHNSKILNSLIVGVIGCMMIYIDTHNDFDSIFPIYTLTLRLLMISLITLFSKNINLFFVLIVLTLTRLFTYDDLRLNLIISILCFSVVLITGIINHLFKVSKYLKWCYVVGVIGFISILFLEFIDFSIILILDYMVFLSSIIIVTYLFYLYHLSRNKNNNICYKFNQTVIENNYDSLLSNKMTYSVILIEITNLKRLKTIINLGEYNKIISQISCLIKSKVNSMGEVCDLRTDQYCVIFKKDLIDTTNWGIEVCLEIENFLNKYTIPIRIKASYKLMDGKDFVYYYNPQYLLSNI